MAAALLVACSEKDSNQTASEGLSADVVNNFEITQVVKTAQRNYLCKGVDALFDDSIPIYSVSTVAIQWPVKLDNYSLKNLQDSLQTMAFGTASVPIDNAIINALNHPQGEELYTMEPVDSIPYNKNCMVLYKTVIASAVSFSPQFIVYQVMTSMYDGGAHGIALSRYLTYVFKLDKILDIPTAFRPGSEEALLKAIKDQLMTQYGVTSLVELNDSGIFTDQIYVSPNFYIHGYDIVFHYNPYDIATFSEGSIDVRVPYQSVAEHLTPTMLAIMERDGI
ncbi:MAG: RsiV family protein [Muribaculum sp.]|nr:RsiV family protein [Muribaculaceae bacterium]MCM1081465.1 RsiV family protein [Muribaculum sp.]